MKYVTCFTSLWISPRLFLFLFLLLQIILIQLTNAQRRYAHLYLSEVKYNYETTNIYGIKYQYSFSDSKYTRDTLLDFFMPTLVMLPPESWMDLCGTAIPNVTRKEIRTIYKKYSSVYKYKTTNVWLFSNQTLSSETHTNNSCSTAEKLTNVQRLNTFISRYTNNDIEKVSKLILVGNNDWYDGLFPEQYVNSIDLLVIDKSIPIENNLMKEQNVSGVNAHFLGTGSFDWSYYMAITEDTNEDSEITFDDYETYLLRKNSNVDGDNNSDNTSVWSNDSSNTSDEVLKVMGIIFGTVIAFVFFIVLCVKANDHSDNPQMLQPEQQQQQQRQDQQQIQNRYTFQSGTQSTSNPSNNNTNSASLTENDFASLPQMIYHEKTRVPMTRIDAESSLIDIDAILDQTIQESAQPQDDNNKNIGMTIQEEITNSTDSSSSTTTTGSTTLNRELSLSHFHKTYGVDLKALECCSICLEEFNEDEAVTALPRCCHLFHTACIGQWLLQNKSTQCPMCKCSVV